MYKVEWVVINITNSEQHVVSERYLVGEFDTFFTAVSVASMLNQSGKFPVNNIMRRVQIAITPKLKGE